MNTRTFCKTLTVFLALLVFSGAAQAHDPKVDELSRHKMADLHEPKIETAELENGMKLYYLQDAELPILNLSVHLPFGEIHETKDERGLTAMFMAGLRSGGTKTVPAAKLDEELEFLAASIGSASGEELSSVEAKCLLKDADRVLELFFKILREPAFDGERIDVMKKSALNSIKRRNEEPMPIAMREFGQLLYGEDSPHAWASNPQTVQAVTPEVLNKFYESRMTTNAWVAATSPLSFEEFTAKFKKQMGDWKKSAAKNAYPTDLKRVWPIKQQFVQKTGNQSAIVAGHFGERRNNPDKFKILIANEILGGATFGAKLGDRIRTELGLTYGITSYFGFGTDYEAFVIASSTKSESTTKALAEIKKIYDDFVNKKNVSSTELDLAKERILNRLVFEQESPFHIVQKRIYNDYVGYPADYIHVVQKGIESVSLDDVKAILPQYFHPDKLSVLIVGDRNQVTDLKTAGSFEDRPLDME